jgi:gas vesicle protein
MSDNESAASFIMGIIAGAVVGLAIGFLYAPYAGKETRTKIKERGEEVRDKAEEIIEEAKERAKRIIADARGRAAEIKEKG